MLFLIRSAVCIGLVASALPVDPLSLASEDTRQSLANAALGALCRTDLARCRELAEVILPETAAGVPAVRKLRDQPTARAQRLPSATAVL